MDALISVLALIAAIAVAVAISWYRSQLALERAKSDHWRFMYEIERKFPRS